MNEEMQRLAESRVGKANWKRWGPYLAEREWGTVREDYSRDGNAWDYVTHDSSRSRAYRWGEDGIAGICDEDQILCFATSFWNGRDPILKDRLFGLSGNEGNHGEDVKEVYYYLDSTPTHSYMKALYKYPQVEFPYARLVDENRRRSRKEPEFELMDTGVFDGDRYFDIFIEYAKVGPEDIFILVIAHNRGHEAASIHILPTLWFRNTWDWGTRRQRPEIQPASRSTLKATHGELGMRYLCCEGKPKFLFCDNDTNVRRFYGTHQGGIYFKDGINDYLVGGNSAAVNPSDVGTKAAAHFFFTVPGGDSVRVRLRLANNLTGTGFEGFDELLARRRAEADEFYQNLQSNIMDSDARNVQRQALAGMLWSKQYYSYDVMQWLRGDPGQPPPPIERLTGRNSSWIHLNNAEILSMPDSWEYPWYAAWDLAFHCIPLAMVDAEFAKEQLVLLTREWYMHPNGQLPAYEWSFDAVNPPVHAWAAWRVFKIDQKMHGSADTDFLERIFHKLLLNFTWWVNRKDAAGRNIFQGGFLGLDNIGVFDRSAPLPTGGSIEQADATSWMGMYSLTMMKIALELAVTKPIYQDMATKFFEHFLYIAGAMANIGGKGINLWDENDEFFYDVLHTAAAMTPLRVRSLVGLIPLFAVETLEPYRLEKVPDFKRRLEWFLNYRPDLAALVSRWYEPGLGERRLLSLLRGHRMKRILRRLLDPAEFLSDFGVRSLSKYHSGHPYVFHFDGGSLTVGYEPAEAGSALFGGNSNWRGPIWFPSNFLIIESLQKFHHYYGDDFTVECPTGSGRFMTLNGIAEELTRRLARIFLRNEQGRRPVFGQNLKLQTDPHFRDYLLFSEYFHGDSGQGLGASHQTGWTGLIAKLLQPREKEKWRT